MNKIQLWVAIIEVSVLSISLLTALFIIYKTN